MFKLTCLLFISIISFSSYASDANPKIVPFSTDGCSSFPDGTHKDKQDFLEWRHCCIMHDFDYYIGGIFSSKYQTDKRLSMCVDKALKLDKVSGISLGHMMRIGVSIGGLPKFLSVKSSAGYKWGYGQPNNDGFNDISSNETHKSLIKELELFQERLQNMRNSDMKMNKDHFLQLKTYLKRKIDFMGNKFLKIKRYRNIITD